MPDTARNAVVVRGETVAWKAPAESTVAVAAVLPSAASIATGVPAASAARPISSYGCPGTATSCGGSSSSR